MAQRELTLKSCLTQDSEAILALQGTDWCRGSGRHCEGKCVDSGCLYKAGAPGMTVSPGAWDSVNYLEETCIRLSMNREGNESQERRVDYREFLAYQDAYKGML